MAEAAAIEETVNAKMISHLLIIYRVAHRALSAEERVGQQIQRNARAEIEGLLIQMMAIEKLAHAALPKEGRELLDLGVAKEEIAAIFAEGRKAH
jgi:hypothetical protein